MPKKEKKVGQKEQEGIKVYELSFHFVSTLSEDDVPVQFSQLKSFVEKLGGEIIAEEAPKLRDLAYEITKKVNAINKRYTQSYFGWVKFALAPEKLVELEKQVKLFEAILRYLLIKTVRENTYIGIAQSKEAVRDHSDESVDTEEATEDAVEAVEETDDQANV
jgi:ribosomal protein S6